MNRAIGTCSNCGGRVSVPKAWMSVTPAIPRCESCGACMAQPHGPVVPMAPTKSMAVETQENAIAALIQRAVR